MRERDKNKKNLQLFICKICKKEFLSYLSPIEIKLKKERKVCSKKCKIEFSRITNRRGLYKNCEICDKEFWCRPSENIKGKHFKKYCSIKCLRSRPLLNGRVGGKFISSDGYIMLQVGRRQIKEHRYLMEQHLGRKLLSKEIVHHKDHNKLNNNFDNLELMTRHEHNLIHHPKRYKDGLTNRQRFSLRHPTYSRDEARARRLRKRRAKEAQAA